MNDNILKLLQDRYFLKDEKEWDDIAKRVSKLYEPIYEDIRDMNFIPSSPTLMNANTNNERKGTLSSCFPMAIEDSIEGIFDALKECAIVTKASGGVGYDHSQLRSSQENIISLNRNSSGPLPFINIFNAVLDGIQQNGVRRGAGASILSIEHPDILDFIEAKKDLTKFNRFNFSVKIIDEFYNKLQNNPKSIHQVKLKSGEYIDLIDKNNNKVTVSELWLKIVKNAWNSAEPGLMNYSIAWNRCPIKNVTDYVLSNPCLLNTAKILTPQGIKNLNDIEINDIIWSKEGWTKVINKFCTGKKEVFRYYTTAGTFESTDNHEIITNGVKTQIKNAKSIDILSGNYEPLKKFNPDYIMDGLVLGDGAVHKASNNLIYLIIGKNDQDYFNSEVEKLIIKDRQKAFKNGYEIKTSLTPHEICKTYNRQIPERFLKLNKDDLYSFLRGLYSANSSIVGDRITYKSASFNMIKSLQIILSSLGIRTYYTTNKPKKVNFRNGEYQCKQSYDLSISNDRQKFYESIGFLQKYKMEKLEILIQKCELRKNKNKIKESFEIKKIESLGIQEVYDITVNNLSHTFWCYGFNISNCHEFVSAPYSSCCLASINLYNLVNKDNQFDWIKYADLIKKGVFFLNSVLDNNSYPLEKIKNVTLNIRPIGLGIMGLAHCLYKLNISYNSEEAYQFTDKVIKYLTLKGMETSVKLAKEYGSYPSYDYELFINANKRFFEIEYEFAGIDLIQLQKDLKKYGSRNSYISSIAPTGSISFLAETSGGIEPVFALAYKRKIEKLNKQYDEIFITDPVFDKYLDNNYSDKKLNILEEVSSNNGSCQKSKYLTDKEKQIFVVASDIKPLEHLQLLSKVSYNVSLSVSKTINLPSNATVQDIEEVYLQAHKLGIIGVTVYRDGCREGILIREDNNQDKRIAKKRPIKVKTKIYKINFKGERWNIFLGLVDNKPFEIFAGKENGVHIEDNVEECFLIKKSKKIYQVEIDGKIVIEDINKYYDNPTNEGLTRLISLALRHEIDLKFIVEQLQKAQGSILSLEKSIAKALLKYIKVGEKSSVICPECGEKLVFSESCMKCPTCFYSLCG